MQRFKQIFNNTSQTNYIIKVLMICYIVLLYSTYSAFSKNIFSASDIKARINNSHFENSHVDFLLKIGEANISRNPDKANIVCYLALTMAERIGYQEGANQAHINLGVIAFERGNYHAALESFNKGVEGCLSNRDYRGLANCYNNIGNIFHVQSKFIKALFYYRESLKINEKMSNDSKVANCLVNIGSIHKSLENYKHAEIYYAQALRINKKNNNKLGIAYCLLNMGNLRGEIKDSENALRYFNQAVRIGIEFNDLKLLSYAYNSIGSTYVNMNLIHDAIEYYGKSLGIKLQLDDKSGAASTYNNIALCKIFDEEYPQAIKYARKALSIADEIGSIKIKRDVYQNMSRAYDSLGATADAYKYYKLFAETRDSVSSMDTRRRILDLELAYEEEKNEKEIKNLHDQYFRQALLVEIEKEKKQTLMILLISVTVTLLIIMKLISLRNKFKQNEILSSEALINKKRQLNAVVEAQDEERARFARDVHDGIGQLFSVLKLKLTNLKGNDEIKYVKASENQEILNIIDEMYSEIRNISFNIMPQVISLNGLIAGVEELIKRINSAGKVLVALKVYNMSERLPYQIELALYRIIQELFSNIIKHSSASEINIQFTRSDKFLNIMIEDNAPGFNVEEMQFSDGHGIKNINSRIEMLNATMVFDTNAGKAGTIVTIDLPL
jgi:two-component system, NarL family, sensor kinase